MRPPLHRLGIWLIAVAAIFASAPAAAQQPSPFADAGTLRLGELDLQVGRSSDRWTSSLGGAIALDDNTFLFGREDTYESEFTRKGITRPDTGATFGIGMKFRFDPEL